MSYDLDHYRPSYYYTPRYQSSYSGPTYRYISSYTSSIRPLYRNNLDIPDYKYRYYTTIAPSTIRPAWSEADRYSFIHGLTFKETAADIRYGTNKVLEDIRSPRSLSIPRYTCASSLDSDAISRARSLRICEQPSYNNISKCIVYWCVFGYEPSLFELIKYCVARSR